MSEIKNLEIEESQKRILEFSSKINKLDTYDRKKIFLSLNHSSKSGKTDSISVFFPIKEYMVKVDWDVASVLDTKIDDEHGGVKFKSTSSVGLDLLDNLFSKVGVNCWRKKYKMEWINEY